MINQEYYRADLQQYNITRDVKTSKFWSNKIKEYIFSSGNCHSIRDFVEKSFKTANIEGKWIGTGLDEKYIDTNNNLLIEVDSKYFRPVDVEILQGSYELAKKDLNWQPKVSFNELITRMTLNDIKNYAP